MENQAKSLEFYYIPCIHIFVKRSANHVYIDTIIEERAPVTHMQWEKSSLEFVQRVSESQHLCIDILIEMKYRKIEVLLQVDCVSFCLNC